MITDSYRTNFETLCQASSLDRLCLVECTERASGQLVYVVAAVNQVGEDIELVPLARLFDGNPYEELAPPEVPS
jgi:hypothetical protein